MAQVWQLRERLRQQQAIIQRHEKTIGEQQRTIDRLSKRSVGGGGGGGGGVGGLASGLGRGRNSSYKRLLAIGGGPGGGDGEGSSFGRAGATSPTGMLLAEPSGGGGGGSGRSGSSRQLLRLASRSLSSREQPTSKPPNSSYLERKKSRLLG